LQVSSLFLILSGFMTGQILFNVILTLFQLVWARLLPRFVPRACGWVCWNGGLARPHILLDCGSCADVAGSGEV